MTPKQEWHASDLNLFQVVLVETKNVCTRRCWFCKFGQSRQDADTYEMSWNTIEKIISNLADLDFSGRISWFWINEPLLDKRLPKIIELTRRCVPKSFLTIITNGDLLTKDGVKRLTSAGLDASGVSIYEDDMLTKVKLLNEPAIVPIDLRNASPGQLENRGGNIVQRRTAFRALTMKNRLLPCARPFTMLTINVRGQVVLCCADMYSDVVAGDISTERLETIWRSPTFADYRRKLATEGRENLPLCRDCSFAGYAPSVLYPVTGQNKKHQHNKLTRTRYYITTR